MKNKIMKKEKITIFGRIFGRKLKVKGSSFCAWGIFSLKSDELVRTNCITNNYLIYSNKEDADRFLKRTTPENERGYYKTIEDYESQRFYVQKIIIKC